MFRFATLLHAARLALLALVLLSPVAALGQQAPMVGIEPIRVTLTEMETAVRRGGLSGRRLNELTQQLSPIRDELRAKLADLEPRLAEAESRLQRLGPAPAKDAPAEDAAVAAERKRLSDARGEIDAAVKQVQLLQQRADQLSGTFSDRRRAAYAERLLRSTPNVLDPFFWMEVVAALPDEAARGIDFAKSWGSFAQQKGGIYRVLSALLVMLVVLVAFYGFLRWWQRVGLVRRIEARFGKELASFLVFARNAALMPALTLVLTQIVDQFEIMPPEAARITNALVLGVWTASLARAAGLAVLAPYEASRRIVPFDEATAVWLYQHLKWAGRILGLVTVVRALHRTVSGPQVVSDAIQMVFALAIGVLLLHLLMGRRDEEPEGEAPSRTVPGARLIAWLVVAGIAAALLTGYGGLASFIAGRVVFTISLVATLYLLLVVTDAVISRTLSPDARRGRAIAAQLGVEPRRLGLVGTVISGVTRALFVLIVLALAIGRWEIAAADFFEAIRGAAFGIRIGDISISVGAILGAVFLFAVVLALTRVVQRWLEREVLPHTAIEPGLRVSIGTIFGYLGFIVAVVFALAELGIDLQKVALVAGALSVGIGFGLQAIVSNFVSGLILLAERPIRVGDQINVKGEEGVVRRISVRATEIETADQASVIIPNSDLITGAVKNWTHANTFGRTVLKVGVGYDSDPEKVRDILMKCATGHPQVLRKPGPAVLLAELGDSALMFEVYCIVSDLTRRGSIKSEIYFAILKRFREEGIEIPFPQREVRMRSPQGAPEPETKLA